MLIGCGFYALFLVLLFSPPSLRTSSKSLSIWFGVFFVFFFLAESVTMAPYLALGPELSSNSKEREKLYYFFYVFQYIGVLFAAAAPILMNKLFSLQYFCGLIIAFKKKGNIELYIVMIDTSHIQGIINLIKGLLFIN